MSNYLVSVSKKIEILMVNVLTLSTLGKIFSGQYLDIFFSYISQKTGFDFSCKYTGFDIFSF